MNYIDPKWSAKNIKYNHYAICIPENSSKYNRGYCLEIICVEAIQKVEGCLIDIFREALSKGVHPNYLQECLNELIQNINVIEGNDIRKLALKKFLEEEDD